IVPVRFVTTVPSARRVSNSTRLLRSVPTTSRFPNLPVIFSPSNFNSMRAYCAVPKVVSMNSHSPDWAKADKLKERKQMRCHMRRVYHAADRDRHLRLPSSKETQPHASLQGRKDSTILPAAFPLSLPDTRRVRPSRKATIRE